MKARKVLEGASYDPATLKALCQAFDAAWASIEELYYYPAEVETARLKLANSVLAVATLHGTDVDALKNGALQHMALNYRDKTDPAEPTAAPNRSDVRHRQSYNRLAEHAEARGQNATPETE
jgi:hypothetical protein